MTWPSRFPAHRRWTRPSDAASALARLQGALQAFRATTAPLRPHFAYGELSRPEYELAHAMHLANHFSAFTVRA